MYKYSGQEIHMHLESFTSLQKYNSTQQLGFTEVYYITENTAFHLLIYQLEHIQFGRENLQQHVTLGSCNSLKGEWSENTLKNTQVY